MASLREFHSIMSLSLSLRVLAFFVLSALSTVVLAVPYLSIQ